MSLSGALSNAMSGLVANARGTTVISSNIANALNENYGRRARYTTRLIREPL
jgi:flagellar hook-associated protein 1 FlgK